MQFQSSYSSSSFVWLQCTIIIWACKLLVSRTMKMHSSSLRWLMDCRTFPMFYQHILHTFSTPFEPCGRWQTSPGGKSCCLSWNDSDSFVFLKSWWGRATEAFQFAFGRINLKNDKHRQRLRSVSLLHRSIFRHLKFEMCFFVFVFLSTLAWMGWVSAGILAWVWDMWTRNEFQQSLLLRLATISVRLPSMDRCKASWTWTQKIVSVYYAGAYHGSLLRLLVPQFSLANIWKYLRAVSAVLFSPGTALSRTSEIFWETLGK